MKRGSISIVLLFSLLAAAGCVGQGGPAENRTNTAPAVTVAVAPEYAATLDEARERFGEDLPVPEDLPEGYAFESALRHPGPAGYVTVVYAGPAGDLSITRLASVNTTCPDVLTGAAGGVIQGLGIEATLTFAGGDRSDDALKQLRWNRNEATFCITGNLSRFEMLNIAASVGGW